jgi:hypothetical protein
LKTPNYGRLSVVARKRQNLLAEAFVTLLVTEDGVFPSSTLPVARMIAPSIAIRRIRVMSINSGQLSP